jgi:hypothetical protein
LWIGDYVGGEGASVAFSSCQYEPFWIFHLTMYVTYFYGYTIYYIYPHEQTGLIAVAICAYPRPKVEAFPGQYVQVNYFTAAEQSSWGAIKGLYK